jgi:glycerol uptake facilitator protein
MTAERFVAEILGTFTLLLLGDGVVAGVLLAKSKANQLTGVGNSNGWIVITFGWGLAVFAGISVAGLASGAHINPAVSLAVFLDGLANPAGPNAAFGIASLLGYWIAQFIGAMLAAAVVFYHYYPHWKETEDPVLKRAVFCTVPQIYNTTWNLVSEIVGTFALVFVGFSLAGGASPAIGGALAWGLLVLVIGLSLGGTTGYAINPARDLGPRIMHAILPIPGKGDSDWGYSWIPVVGPLIGGSLGWAVWNYLGANFMNVVH